VPAPAPAPADELPVFEPVASDEMVIETPAPPATGMVVVLGDVHSARLRGLDGKTRSPGDLPPGTYTLRVAFPTGTTIDVPRPVVVVSGETTTVRCDVVGEQCR
jgi:hypothetical protein